MEEIEGEREKQDGWQMVSCMNWLKTLTTLAHLPSHYCIISQVYSIKHSTLREGGRGREGRVIILHMNLLVQWMVFQMIFHLVSTLHSQGTVNPRKKSYFNFSLFTDSPSLLWCDDQVELLDHSMDGWHPKINDQQYRDHSIRIWSHLIQLTQWRYVWQILG